MLTLDSLICQVIDMLHPFPVDILDESNVRLKSPRDVLNITPFKFVLKSISEFTKVWLPPTTLSFRINHLSAALDTILFPFSAL